MACSYASRTKMPIPRLTNILAATAISLMHVVSAQSPAPSPFSATAEPTGPTPSSSFGPSAPAPTSNDCFTALLNMSDCLTYVENVSTLTVPDKNCCPELAGLVGGNPICLCELLGNRSLTESIGITIDLTRALKLPSVCRVETPPITLCSLAGYPVPGPMASVASPPAAPTSSVLSTPQGLQPAEASPNPSTLAKKDSGAPVITGSSHAFFVGLAIAFLFTFF